MTFSIDKRLFIYLTLTFIVMTIIGTLSHESGHYFVMKIMGFDARINYMSTISTGPNQPMTAHQYFFSILGGPLQTMYTGTIGLLLLCFYEGNNKIMTLRKWVLIFLTLFWLRQCANFVVWIMVYIITGELFENGDEIKLSRVLRWPDWSVVSFTALIGFIILSLVIFKFIPKLQRFTFILSGLIGGVSGYLLWLVYFGKYIMP